MKRIWNAVMVMTLIAIGGFAMTSCDKDDDDNFTDGGASKIAGTYSGTLDATVMATPCDFDGTYEMELAKQDGNDDEVTVTLPECTYKNEYMPNGYVIPSVTVADVDVERSSTDSNVYILGDKEFDTTVNDMKITGKIQRGKVTGSKIELTYTITPGTMPMSINFTFSGTLK